MAQGATSRMCLSRSPLDSSLRVSLRGFLLLSTLELITSVLPGIPSLSLALISCPRCRKALKIRGTKHATSYLPSLGSLLIKQCSPHINSHRYKFPWNGLPGTGKREKCHDIWNNYQLFSFSLPCTSPVLLFYPGRADINR